MSKRNKKTYAWKTQKDFTSLFVEDVHKIIECLWDILNYFSTRVVQSVDQRFLNYIIQIVKPIPEEVLHIISDLRKLVERSREVERACERAGTADDPVVHVSRLVHIENFKDALRESCRRFRRNCELLHENCLIKEKLFGGGTPKVNEFRA